MTALLGFIPSGVRDWVAKNLVVILIIVALGGGLAFQTARIEGVHFSGPFGLKLGFDGLNDKLAAAEKARDEFKGAFKDETGKRTAEQTQNTTSYIGLQQECKAQIVHVKGADNVIKEIEYAPLAPPSQPSSSAPPAGAIIGADKLRVVFGQTPGPDAAGSVPAGGDQPKGPAATTTSERGDRVSRDGSAKSGNA